MNAPASNINILKGKGYQVISHNENYLNPWHFIVSSIVKIAKCIPFIGSLLFNNWEIKPEKARKYVVINKFTPPSNNFSNEEIFKNTLDTPNNDIKTSTNSQKSVKNTINKYDKNSEKSVNKKLNQHILPSNNNCPKEIIDCDKDLEKSHNDYNTKLFNFLIKEANKDITYNDILQDVINNDLQDLSNINDRLLNF